MSTDRTKIIDTLDALVRKNDIITRGICRMTETLKREDEEIQLILYQLCEMIWDNQKNVEEQLSALREGV